MFFNIVMIQLNFLKFFLINLSIHNYFILITKFISLSMNFIIQVFIFIVLITNFLIEIFIPKKFIILLIKTYKAYSFLIILAKFSSLIYYSIALFSKNFYYFFSCSFPSF